MTDQPKKKKSKFFSFRVTHPLAIFMLVFALPFALFGWRELYVYFFEQDPPRIVVSALPPGIGVDGGRVTVTIKDELSGLKEVSVIAKQNFSSREIIHREYPGTQGMNEDTLIIELGPVEGFSEGDVEIVITAHDRAIWKNAKQQRFSLTLDYKAPAIEVLTKEVRAARGGSVLAFYRLKEERPSFTGVAFGEWRFPGFPAKYLDASFEAAPDVYFALFPVPAAVNAKKDVLAIVARDQVGNETKKPISLKIRKKPSKISNIEITEDYLNRDFRNYLIANNLYKPEQSKVVQFDNQKEKDQTESLLKQFADLREYRDQRILSKLEPILSRPKSRKYWNDSFIRPTFADTRHRFGDMIQYTFEGKEVVKSMHEGITFEPYFTHPVALTNSGTVIFSERIPDAGNTLIVDHGFGLCTMYANLDLLLHREGAELQRGEDLGKPGASGLFAAGELEYQMLLHGIQVDPREWWDDEWVAKNITKKTLFLKKKLSLPLLPLN